jgi:hypothetical protein
VVKKFPVNIGIISGKDRKPFQKGAGALKMAEAIATKDNP